MADELNEKLKNAAVGLVGKDAVKSKFGIDCFGLVDKLLRKLGAKTAKDGDVAITLTADYDWGDGILLESIQPGDILQFSKHVVHIETVTKTASETRTTTRTLTRPHHTAIVVEVHDGGGVTVVEQNVSPNKGKVTRNLIPLLEGEVTKKSGDSKTTIKVTGGVRAYHPAMKDTGASLSPSHQSAPGGGSRQMAFFAPAQGGGKRVPGPLGKEGRRPDDPDDFTRLV